MYIHKEVIHLILKESELSFSEIQMINHYMKVFPILLAVKNCKIKTTITYHLTACRRNIIKKT